MRDKLRPGDLVYVKYWDHLLFRNSDPSIHKPVLRECVGWLLEENPGFIKVLWDRSVEKLPQERTLGSGLAILKTAIVEVRRLTRG